MTILSHDIIIAIDGYASSGKSTLAKDLAAELQYRYIDTGAMYRAVTLFALRHHYLQPDGTINNLNEHLPEIHIDFRLINGKNHTFLNEKSVETEIRSMEISNLVSTVSSLDYVRAFLVEQQRTLGPSKRLVMDGRDIGTVVFPDAEMKFFVTASLEERSRRRYEELKKNNPSISFESVKQNLHQRDVMDTERKISPLKQADDAILIDNTHLSRKEQLTVALQEITNRFS
jgi:cytidylate kinase